MFSTSFLLAAPYELSRSWLDGRWPNWEVCVVNKITSHICCCIWILLCQFWRWKPHVRYTNECFFFWYLSSLWGKTLSTRAEKSNQKLCSSQRSEYVTKGLFSREKKVQKCFCSSAFWKLCLAILFWELLQNPTVRSAGKKHFPSQAQKGNNTSKCLHFNRRTRAHSHRHTHPLLHPAVPEWQKHSHKWRSHKDSFGYILFLKIRCSPFISHLFCNKITRQKSPPGLKRRESLVLGFSEHKDWYQNTGCDQKARKQPLTTKKNRCLPSQLSCWSLLQGYLRSSSESG